MKRIIALFLLVIFSIHSINPGVWAAQGVESFMPPVGEMIALTAPLNPPVLQGMIVHPEEPFRFDFVLDQGDAAAASEDIESLNLESEKLVKYFLTVLTIPQQDLWVNLSPYEQNRISPEAFGQTIMGRDLLAQDYLLKQLTASLIYPEKEIGRSFWEQIYESIYSSQPDSLQAITDVGEMMSAGKIWIVPDTAEVYVDGTQVFILKSRLKVMMEEEYLSASEEKRGQRSVVSDQKIPITDSIKQIIIPAIEKEVNEGAHFAPLRQIYHSMVLASWFKRNLQESLLTQKYSDQKKVDGVDLENKDEKQQIYEQYVASFKEGVFDLIREEYDPLTQEIVPRRYIAGGLGFTDFAMAVTGNKQRYAQRYHDLKAGGHAFMRLQGRYQKARKESTRDDFAITVDQSILNTPYMKSLFDRFSFMRERLEKLLTMNHPLKEEAMREMASMSREEIFQLINHQIQLREDGRGMGYPQNSIEDTFYQITIGFADVSQIWRGIYNYENSKNIEEMKQSFSNEQIKAALKKAYAPLFAFKYLYEENKEYFPSEMKEFLLKQYLTDEMLYEMREVERLKYSLSARLQAFVFFLLENLMQEDSRQKSVDELRPLVEEAWQNPGREAERQSIINFLTILEELKKRSGDWKEVLEEDGFMKASAEEFAMIHASQERLDLLREVSEFTMKEQNEEEILAIVDENGNFVRKSFTSQKSQKSKNEYTHGAVVIFADRQGNILMQKRSNRKAEGKGPYDWTVGGHRRFNEDILETAIREIKEESLNGLSVIPENLIKIDQRVVNADLPGRWVRTTFLRIVDEDEKKNINEMISTWEETEEVEGWEWWSQKKVLTEVAKGENSSTWSTVMDFIQQVDMDLWKEIEKLHSDFSMATQTGNLRVPVIPSDAFNVLDLEEMGAMVATAKEINETMPEHFLTKTMEENFRGSDSRLSYEDHVQMLKRLGQEAQLKGPAVYMPFGGFDIYTPFNLVEDSDDVFSVGLNSFGTLEEVMQLLFRPDLLVELLESFRSFDYVRIYSYINEVLEMDGLGALAIYRAIILLKADIQRISYFYIDASGEIVFSSKEEILSGQAHHNAVVEFIDPRDKKLKRFWYMQMDLMHARPGFLKFINKLHFQSFLLKGAFLGKRNWTSWVKASVLQPAKINNARVFHDQVTVSDNSPCAIWKKGHTPSRIELKDLETIGYSGDYVYYGDASDLDINDSPQAYSTEKVAWGSLSDQLVEEFPDSYQNKGQLKQMVESIVDEYNTVDEKIAQIWADYFFSGSHLNSFVGSRRYVLDQILRILSKASESDDARLFAWRIGQQAYENTLKRPWAYGEFTLLTKVNGAEEGVLLDLASGLRAGQIFQGLNPENQYILVDNRYEMEGFINRAIEEYEAYDYVEFQREDFSMAVSDKKKQIFFDEEFVSLVKKMFAPILKRPVEDAFVQSKILETDDTVLEKFYQLVDRGYRFVMKDAAVHQFLLKEKFFDYDNNILPEEALWNFFIKVIEEMGGDFDLYVMDDIHAETSLRSYPIKIIKKNYEQSLYVDTFFAGSIQSRSIDGRWSEKRMISQNILNENPRRYEDQNSYDWYLKSLDFSQLEGFDSVFSKKENSLGKVLRALGENRKGQKQEIHWIDGAVGENRAQIQFLEDNGGFFTSLTQDVFGDQLGGFMITRLLNRLERVSSATVDLDGTSDLAMFFQDIYDRALGQFQQWHDRHINPSDYMRMRAKTRLTAVDIEDHRWKRHPQIDFMREDVMESLMGQKADLITLLQIWQYVRDPLRLLVNSYNSLNDKGVAIIGGMSNEISVDGETRYDASIHELRDVINVQLGVQHTDELLSMPVRTLLFQRKGDVSLRLNARLVGWRTYEKIDPERPLFFIEEKEDFSLSVSNSPLNKKGGIDLNPDLLDLKEKGNQIHFDIPQSEDPLFQGEFDGLVPVIYSITPIQNLPVFFGMKDSEDKERPDDQA